MYWREEVRGHSHVNIGGRRRGDVVMYWREEVRGCGHVKCDLCGFIFLLLLFCGVDVGRFFNAFWNPPLSKLKKCSI